MGRGWTPCWASSTTTTTRSPRLSRSRGSATPRGSTRRRSKELPKEAPALTRLNRGGLRQLALCIDAKHESSQVRPAPAPPPLLPAFPAAPPPRPRSDAPLPRRRARQPGADAALGGGALLARGARAGDRVARAPPEDAAADGRRRSASSGSSRRATPTSSTTRTAPTATRAAAAAATRSTSRVAVHADTDDVRRRRRHHAHSDGDLGRGGHSALT